MDLSSIPGMGIIDSIINPGRPYKDASKELQNYWQQALGIGSPFMDAAKGQLPILTGAENQLLNPVELLKKWTESYKTSPYALQEMDTAKNAGLDAASSMGLMGSSTALSNVQNSASQIMNKDRESFLNNLMQKFMAGLGIGQNIYGQGAKMAGKLAEGSLDVGGEMAKAKYGQDTAGANNLLNLLGIAGGIMSL